MTKASVEVKDCRHGRMSFLAEDEFVGRSLALYGEYSEEEVVAMRKILRPGDVVIEVGSNIGALTVPMAQMIAPDGQLLAFEPHPVNSTLLMRNLDQNGCSCVELRTEIVTDHNGYAAIPRLDELDHHNFGRIEVGRGSLSAPCIRIDDLKLEKLKLLKVDAEGSESEVVRGASETIRRCKPIIYIENDRPEKTGELIAQVIDLGYRAWWHRPPLWNPKNWARQDQNVFGEIVSLNMLCVPEDSGIEVDGMDEVGDLRFDADIYLREIRRYSRIVQRYPTDLRARLMLAHHHSLIQNTAEADALIAENLRRDPEHLRTLAIRGLHNLQRGNFKDGWPGYELRYKQKTSQPFGARHYKVDKWGGEPTKENVLLWCEQGFGDTIMFGRFLKEALTRAPYAVVDVPPQLYELFEYSGLVPHGQLFRKGRSLPPFTKHCSLPSLPAVLGVNSPIEIMADPYLFADPAMVERWKERNVYQAGRPTRIGLCCVGSPFSERPFTRDIAEDLFSPITARHGSFLSLMQQGQFESFADTAAAIKSLDLVITVDTAVAHLAGALGAPTWLLLSFDPDWRWGLNGHHTPWYHHNMRIFRQPKLFDWQSVIDEVAVELDRLE